MQYTRCITIIDLLYSKSTTFQVQKQP